MSNAAQRASKAAEQIVKASNPHPVEPTGEPLDNRQHTAGQFVLSPDRTGVDPLISGVLDLKLAKYAYAAGAAIVRIADEMSEETLRII